MRWLLAFPVDRDELEKDLLFIRSESLTEFARLVPWTAGALIAGVGQGPALALLNALPGVDLLLPRAPTERGPGGRCFRLLCDVMGAEAAENMVHLFGGDGLEVPVCTSLRVEQRKRWARTLFDELTGPRYKMTSGRAIFEIGALCAWVGLPAHHRSIEEWLNKPTPTLRVGGGQRPRC